MEPEEPLLLVECNLRIPRMNDELKNLSYHYNLSNILNCILCSQLFVYTAFNSESAELSEVLTIAYYKDQIQLEYNKTRIKPELI